MPAQQFAAIAKGCSSARKKLTRAGELVQAQRGNILFTKWHGKRNVPFLSSIVSPEEASRTVKGTIKGQKVEIVKHASIQT